MTKRSHIKHLVGLDNELSMLVDRIQDLCSERTGGTVLLTSRRGRGKTLLWNTALEIAKERFSPLVVSIDLEDSPRTSEELMASVRAPGFLPPKMQEAAIVIAKAFADAAVQIPSPWISKFIIKFIAVLPEVAKRLTKEDLARRAHSQEWGFNLLREIVTTVSQHGPLMLVIENIETVSAMPTDRAIEEIVDLIRHNLPVLLIVTLDDTQISDQSMELLKMRIDVGDAALCTLPVPSEKDFDKAFGPMSRSVLNELDLLAEENVSTFEDLWQECQELKLIAQSRRGWTWNLEAETAQLGKLTKGAYCALGRILQRSVDRTGNEKLVRLALGCAALQGQRFCDEIVANVLWRCEIRLAEQYTGENGHVAKTSSFFDDQMSELVGQSEVEGGMHFHNFRAFLFRHYAKSDVPSEYRKTLSAFTADALQQIFAADLKKYAWLIIELYFEAGELDRAHELQDEVTRPPSRSGQEWELLRLSEKIRSASNDAHWSGWVIYMSERVQNPALKEQVARLLDEAIEAMLTIGETQQMQSVILAKARYLYNEGHYADSYALVTDLVRTLDENSANFDRASDDQAKALFKLGRCEEATSIIRSRIAFLEKRFGNKHCSLMWPLNTLASMLHEMGFLTEAENLMRRSVKLGEICLAPEDSDLASLLSNASLVFIAMNRFDDAEPLLMKSVEIMEKRNGPDHPKVALILNNIGMLFVDTDRFAESEPYLRRAAAIYDFQFSSYHPDKALLYSNLGLLLFHTNRLDQAEPLFRTALEMNEKNLGPDHPINVLLLGNVARLLIETNRATEAEPLLQRALELAKRSFRPWHELFGFLYGLLSKLSIIAGRLDEAERLLRQGLVILSKPAAQSGCPNRKMRDGFVRYRQLLQDMSLSEEEISLRFEGIGKEAGFTAGSFRPLIEKLLCDQSFVKGAVLEL